MATPTANQGIPIPDPSDADNVPYSLSQAVGIIEPRLVMRFTTTAARDAAITAPVAGMTAYTSSTKQLWVYDGTGWVRFANVGDTVTVNGVAITLGGSGTVTAAAGTLTGAALAAGVTASSLTSFGNAPTLSHPTITAALPDVQYGNRNLIHNGEFTVSQRGSATAVAATTSGSPTARSGPDRWIVSCGTAGEASWTCYTTPGGGPQGIAGYGRVQRISGQTTTAVIQMTQAIESRDAVRLAGQAATLSFWAHMGANYSATAAALGVRVTSGTGQDENPLSAYTGNVTEANVNVTLTSGWQRFTVALPGVQAGATEANVAFLFTPTGTAGAGDYFDVSGVQFEVGSVATPYEHVSYAQELARCQRFYVRLYGSDLGNFLAATTGTGSFRAWIPLPVTMRAVPTPTTNVNAWSGTAAPSGTQIGVYLSGWQAGTFSSLTLGAGTTHVDLNTAVTGNSTAIGSSCMSSIGSGGYIEVPAEL